ncbi:MAG: transcription-repair coupling factor [Kiritimatiellia bacterium]
MPSPKGQAILGKKDSETLVEIFHRRGVYCAQITPVPGMAAAGLAAARLCESATVIIVTDGPTTMERVVNDVQTLADYFRSQTVCHSFPSAEDRSPSAMGERMLALKALTSRPVVVTCIQALMQPTSAPHVVLEQTPSFNVGDECQPSTLLEKLESSGYIFEPEVLQPGQASWRGGILDAWPPGFDWPVRLEFFGDTIESIRSFDPVEQRSREILLATELPPAAEDISGQHFFADFVESNAFWLWIDRESIEHHRDIYFESLHERGLVAPETLPGPDTIPGSGHLVFALSPCEHEIVISLDAKDVDGLPAAPGGPVPLDVIAGQRLQFLRHLVAQAQSGSSVTLFFSSPGGMERFAEAYRDELPAHALIRFHEGVLSESFHCEETNCLYVSDLDFYGMRREQAGRFERSAKRERARSQAGERLQSWTDIQPGDFVVHTDHGIGIYRGLFEIEVNGQSREVLTIEYAGQAKIYLPVGQTHLLSRYIGVGKRRPELHAIGGKRWTKEKIAAERAVEDMAAMLLETQAERDAKPGHAYSKDTHWQLEFENTFPFDETPDQARAISDVKNDMESARPMDRLICGDVGYGKTEVAMRASFKAVMDGKQVAVLVPTTVLAQQHYDSFSERMAAFPVRIESLSRFKSKAEQQDVLERLADGAVDIVIGTHRLVQNDVRFRDLGLVIIDEEQRFGVKHKERLKRMRQLVDVLTMTATPIPRTLYMSLTGAKDLSIIETAPVERLPIETIITEHKDETIREAILREINREGQVYFLHNRVGTIEQLHLKLANLVPEARIRVAHGQMKEGELSRVMRGFSHGDFDVLLCTTIIESGLNIPNVNTIIIDRADRFGLAELYQLRGRVGRYKRKAFAYLLLPKHGKLFFMARQRIGAIKRYSSLGSGFKLAMRDLEIRGAGNILGSEQSGHIAAIGFDLYCQLLQRTVARMKGDPEEPVIDVEVTVDFLSLGAEEEIADHAAAIPITFIEDETLRVRLYRRIASLNRLNLVDELEAELRDRFGVLPEPAQRLLLLSRIKIAAAEKGIQKIEIQDEKVIMTRRRDFIMKDGKFPRLPQAATTNRLKNLFKLVARI